MAMFAMAGLVGALVDMLDTPFSSYLLASGDDDTIMRGEKWKMGRRSWASLFRGNV